VVRANVLGVAEARKRFSELIERVVRGERLHVTRRGKLVVALVPAAEGHARYPADGLAAIAGALADWKELDAVVSDIYASRRRALTCRVRRS
jgi:prevent-host-death family protein